MSAKEIAIFMIILGFCLTGLSFNMPFYGGTKIQRWIGLQSAGWGFLILFGGFGILIFKTAAALWRLM